MTKVRSVRVESEELWPVYVEASDDYPFAKSVQIDADLWARYCAAREAFLDIRGEVSDIVEGVEP